MKPKQQADLSKLFSLPATHPPSDKILLHLWKKIFLRRYTEICRNLLSKYFNNATLMRQEMG